MLLIIIIFIQILTNSIYSAAVVYPPHNPEKDSFKPHYGWVSQERKHIDDYYPVPYCWGNYGPFAYYDYLSFEKRTQNTLCNKQGPQTLYIGSYRNEKAMVFRYPVSFENPHNVITIALNNHSKHSRILGIADIFGDILDKTLFSPIPSDRFASINLSHVGYGPPVDWFSYAKSLHDEPGKFPDVKLVASKAFYQAKPFEDDHLRSKVTAEESPYICNSDSDISWFVPELARIMKFEGELTWTTFVFARDEEAKTEAKYAGFEDELFPFFSGIDVSGTGEYIFPFKSLAELKAIYERVFDGLFTIETLYLEHPIFADGSYNTKAYHLLLKAKRTEKSYLAPLIFDADF